MENGLLEAIYGHVKQKVTRKSQHGFAKDKICLTYLSTSCDKITSPVDERKPVTVVYLVMIY